jgi:hypothetical protein
MKVQIASISSAVLAGLLFLPLAARGSEHPSTLFDLPIAAQSNISAALGKVSRAYSLQPVPGGFDATNVGQKLTAHFTSHGAELHTRNARWQMQVRSYGYGSELLTLEEVSPQLNRNRVDYPRRRFAEWYVNGPMGLEQGFTISEAPGKADGKPLTISISLAGDFTTVIDENREGLTLKLQNGTGNLRYAGLSASDAAGKNLSAWLELQGDRLLLKVDDAGAQYPLTIDPVIQQAELIASDAQPFNFLGYSAAISGNTVVVGAPGYANAYQGEVVPGRAYVFVKPASGWTNMFETAELKSSDSGSNPGNNFALSVAIAGNTIVVGDVDNSGEAYIFVEPANGWQDMTETAILSGPSPDAEGFGAAVAIDSSGGTIVVGAINGVVSDFSQGTAYVFEKPSGGWQSTSTATAELIASDGAAADAFGCSVAIDDDTIVVGAEIKPYPYYFGAVYVFAKPTSGWKNMTQTAKLTATKPTYMAVLGASVAVLGDTVVAGAPRDNQSSPGQVYVYVEPAGGWKNMTQTALLTTSHNYTDWLGNSIAINDTTIVAGSPFTTVGGNLEQGSVYFFAKPKTGWVNTSTPTEQLNQTYGASDFNFGWSVALEGTTVVSGASEVGEAFVFFTQ